MTDILIAGCGYVGCALALERLALGDRVWGLRRDPDGLPDGVRPIAADLSRPETLRELPPVDAVVLAASPSRGATAPYRAVYVEGLSNLLAALDASRVRRVILTSTTGVYHQRDGEWVDEDSPTEPSHDGARATLEGEQALLSSPFEGVVLRLAGIYGPGRVRFLEQVRGGHAARYADVTHYTNRIHRDDCAGVLSHLLDLDHPAPRYIGVDHDPCSRDEIVLGLAERLGAPTPPVIPYAEASERARRSNKRCRNQRLIDSGYVFRRPSWREGYGAMIDAAE